MILENHKSNGDNISESGKIADEDGNEKVSLDNRFVKDVFS
jgi:hypothetical protein